MDGLSLSLKNIFTSSGETIRKAPKYNVIVCGGEFGGGKTIFLTYWAVNQEETARRLNREFTYAHIYANYHLNNVPRFTYLNPSLTRRDLFDLVKPRSLLLIDEADDYASNRDSMKGENKDRMRFFFQVRKIECDVIMNIPVIQYLDKRYLRLITEFYEGKGEISKNAGIYEYARLIPASSQRGYIDYMDFYEAGSFYIDMKKYYQFYDHTERIHK